MRLIFMQPNDQVDSFAQMYSTLNSSKPNERTLISTPSIENKNNLHHYIEKNLNLSQKKKKRKGRDHIPSL